MKIKRVFAADMRQAIRKVREEHGPDAVILSSRNVENGVEVISAMDYDERAVQAAAERGGADFRDALASVTAGSGRLSVTVGDDDDEPSTSGSGDGPAAGRDDAPVPRIEWPEEPAVREMREELRTLRSLFENQLTLLEWQQLGKRNPARATLLRRLNDLGLGPDVCRKLADRVGDQTDPERAWQQALILIARHLPVTDDDILAQGGVVAVVGPTGVGKTTTVAKLAARYALRHGKRHVALITTDNFRIGGQEQLRSFARILGVPVFSASDADELAAALGDLDDKRLLLIDTAGMSQRDMRLAEQFATLAGAGRPVRPYLVLSANTQLSALMQIVRAFRCAAPVGCILSKVDEATSLGGALTAVLRSRLPVAYLGVGQRVPEDLQPARGERLLAQAHILAKRYAADNDDEALAMVFGGAGGKGR